MHDTQETLWELLMSCARPSIWTLAWNVNILVDNTNLSPLSFHLHAVYDHRRCEIPTITTQHLYHYYISWWQHKTLSAACHNHKHLRVLIMRPLLECNITQQVSGSAATLYRHAGTAIRLNREIGSRSSQWIIAKRIRLKEPDPWWCVDWISANDAVLSLGILHCPHQIILVL
jgi:hypothetical protein